MSKGLTKVMPYDKAELMIETYDPFLKQECIVKFPDMETVFKLLTADDNKHGKGRVSQHIDSLSGDIYTMYPSGYSRRFIPDRNAYYWNAPHTSGTARQEAGRVDKNLPLMIGLPPNVTGIYKPSRETRYHGWSFIWEFKGREGEKPTSVSNFHVSWNQTYTSASPRYKRSGALQPSKISPQCIEWYPDSKGNGMGPAFLNPQEYQYAIDGMIIDPRLFAMRYEMIYLEEYVEPDKKQVLLDIREDLDNIKWL